MSDDTALEDKVISLQDAPDSVKDLLWKAESPKVIEEILKQHKIASSTEAVAEWIETEKKLAESPESHTEPLKHDLSLHDFLGESHRGGHGGHSGHAEQPDLLSKEMQDDEEYKKILEKKKDPKKPGWYGENDQPGEKRVAAIAEWENNKKINPKGLSIDSEDGNNYLREHPDNPESYATKKEAEAEFRETHKDLAKAYDKKELQRRKEAKTQEKIVNSGGNKQKLKALFSPFAKMFIPGPKTNAVKDGKLDIENYNATREFAEVSPDKRKYEIEPVILKQEYEQEESERDKANFSPDNVQSLFDKDIPINPAEGIGEVAPEAASLAETAPAVIAPVAEGGAAGGAPAGLIIAIIIGVIILIILLIILFIVLWKLFHDQQNGAAIPGLTITLTGPTTITNGGKLDYTVNVACDTTCQTQGTILIYEDPLPTGTTFVSADGNYTTSPHPITWNLSDNQPTTDSSGTNNYTFHFSLNATTAANNSNIANIIYGELAGGTQPVPGLTLSVTAPQHVNNTAPNSITYIITANYTGTDPSVIVYAPIPQNTTLVGNPTGKFSNNAGILSWVLKDNGKSPYTFTFTVQPNSTVKDVVIPIDVYATAQGSGSGNNIVWLDSGASGQFYPHLDWIGGQCSQASLTEVLNAYKQKPGGGLYKIVDIATISQKLGVWDNAFLGPFRQNWGKEATCFNMNVSYNEYDVTMTNLTTVLNMVNQGHPVIVGAPNHYLVLWKSDGQYIYALDSSPHNYTWADQTTADSVTLNGALHKYRFAINDFLNGGFDSFSRRDTPKFDPTYQDQSGYWNGVAIFLTPQSTTGSACKP